MKIIMLVATLGAASIAASASAQADPTRAYIDAGFAMMDGNKDGRVERAEFETFMKARLARQAQRFDAVFVELDANKDGRISRKEAAAVSGLAENFAEVDVNGDGNVDKTELRTAAAQAQMQDAGLTD